MLDLSGHVALDMVDQAVLNAGGTIAGAPRVSYTFSPVSRCFSVISLIFAFRPAYTAFTTSRLKPSPPCCFGAFILDKILFPLLCNIRNTVCFNSAIHLPQPQLITPCGLLTFSGPLYITSRSVGAYDRENGVRVPSRREGLAVFSRR